MAKTDKSVATEKTQKTEEPTHSYFNAHSFEFDNRTGWNFSVERIPKIVEKILIKNQCSETLAQWPVVDTFYKNLARTKSNSNTDFVRAWIDIIVSYEVARIYKSVYDALGGNQNKDADKKATQAIEEFKRECK